jgi:hypothetical protein
MTNFWPRIKLLMALNADEYSANPQRRPPMIRLGCLLAVLPLLAFAAENRDTKVRNDRADVMSDGRWIYNDFPRALAEAQRSGKPLLAVLRCVP